jgi:uncharacterized RmlC-like cupin family protein
LCVGHTGSTIMTDAVEEVFSENAPVEVNRTDPNEHESVVMRPDLEAKVP